MNFIPETRLFGRTRTLLLGTGLMALTACSGGNGINFDMDFRGFAGNGLSTREAAMSATAPRPTPDARGVISYTDYQVAVAREGDTLTTLSSRVGLPEAEIARYNGLNSGTQLRDGEIIALPRRVNAQNVDVTTLAGNALDRIGPDPAPSSNASTPTAETPVRHQVVRGETAYSIARLYGVSVRALAEWNSLDSSLTVREGQFLLIPTGQVVQTAASTDTAPGVGTPTPLPPSSGAPLPDAPQVAGTAPNSPNMSGERTAASSSQMAMPASGKIVGAYVKGKSDGIDISAPAGTNVVAAASGTVAAITRDTNDVPILVLRHSGNLLTVYAGIDDIAVQKGASVTRGQTIAKVRKSDNPGLHFQVRKGTASVDPMDYLN